MPLTWGPAQRGAQPRVQAVCRRQTLGPEGIHFPPGCFDRKGSRPSRPGYSGSDEADDKMLLS